MSSAFTFWAFSRSKENGSSPKLSLTLSSLDAIENVGCRLEMFDHLATLSVCTVDPLQVKKTCFLKGTIPTPTT